MVTCGYELVIVLTLFGMLYIYFKRKFSFFKERGIPHRKPTFPFGNLLELVFYKDYPANFFAKLYNEFDAPCVGFYSLTKPYILIKDPELIKRILIKDFDSFTNRCFFSDSNVEPVMSNSLFAIRGPRWKDLRRKLSPVFTSGKVKLMMPLMIECGKNLEAYLSVRLNETLELKDVAAKFTTDVIASCAFGLNANSFEKDSEFLNYGKLIFAKTRVQGLRSMSYIFAHEFVKIFKYPFFNKSATDFFRSVFLETLEERKSYKSERNDLIDLLNEIRQQENDEDVLKFDDDIIYAQALIFFGAAQEATSSAIAFTLHELSVNPNIQEKLREEVYDITESYGGITYEAVQNMQYLNMVVSETLRKYPLTPLLNRESVQQYKLPNSQVPIDKGIPILISQKALHWDPRYFPNPKKFDPERFNKENKAKIPNYVYLPFGDGPRNCIGERFALLSAKLGLIYALKKFRVEINSKTEEPLVFERVPLLKAKRGVNLTLKKVYQLKSV